MGDPYPYYQTNISVSQTLMEIKELLTKYGARYVTVGDDQGDEKWEIFVQFQYGKFQFKILRNIRQPKFKSRSYARAIYWSLKAKLEMIKFDIDLWVKEFLPDLMIDGQMTVCEALNKGGLNKLLLTE